MALSCDTSLATTVPCWPDLSCASPPPRGGRGDVWELTPSRGGEEGNRPLDRPLLPGFYSDRKHIHRRNDSSRPLLVHNLFGIRTPPRPLLSCTPLAQARACPSAEWTLKCCFQDFLGPLFFVVLSAGLGVCDALVEGKGGSFVSVIVHSVHNNIVPPIATACLSVWM